MTSVKDRIEEQKRNKYLIGLVRIKQNCPEQQAKVIKSLAQQQIRTNYLILRGNFTQTQLWHQILPFVEELKVQSLGLHSLQPQKFRNLCFPWYSHLKVIDISYSKILCLESLIYMDAQKLQSLNMEYNLITTMKSLAKAHWPSLKIVQLRQPKSTQFPSDRMRTEPQNFKLKITNGQAKEDCSIYAKAQATNIDFLNDNRIKISQNRFQIMIKNRKEGGKTFDQLSQMNEKKNLNGMA